MTGPIPNKPGMTARGGALRIGDLHPARGAGIDHPPEKSRGALGRLISKPGGSASSPLLFSRRG